MALLDDLHQAVEADGLVRVARMADALAVSRAQLAGAIGLSRDAVSKAKRLESRKTQARLRDVIEILVRISAWAGSPQQAFVWYRAQPIPSFGDQTAEDLVKQGRAEAVKRYLSRIAVGGYA